jgi:hypothetical protein
MIPSSAGSRMMSQPTAALWPDWRHHAFITEREHRQPAVVELVIRDHKDGALRHLPSGHYAANGAWLIPDGPG